MMKDIILNSRYGDKYVLKAVDDNTYFFASEQSPYMRVSISKDGYKYIDPEGGPFIEVGEILGDKTLKQIVYTTKGFNLIVE